jgi:hypothetical protein
MPPVELNDELVEISGELLKKITSGSLTAKWLINFARKAHHIQSGGASTTKDYIPLFSERNPEGVVLIMFRKLLQKWA